MYGFSFMMVILRLRVLRMVAREVAVMFLFREDTISSVIKI